MFYFAYGSNLSSVRLQGRVPSACLVGCFYLKEHKLKFHKLSKDGSGKADSHYTGNSSDIVYGAVYEIRLDEKPTLDKVEGFNHGYDEKEVVVYSVDGSKITACTYVAEIESIDTSLIPYSWYLNHVLIGAREVGLPDSYIDNIIVDVKTVKDSNAKRRAKEFAIHS